MKRSIAWLMKGKLLALTGGAMVLGLLGSANWVVADSPTFEPADRTKVVEFAAASMNKRIGSGDSTDLVNSALKHAYAMTQRLRSKNNAEKVLEAKAGAKFPDTINVWGTQVRSLARGKNGIAVLPYGPGCVIQFEDCIFEKPDGTQRWELLHHTAIVKSAKGSYVTLVHQNYPKGSAVNETSLDINWLKAGSNGKKGHFWLYSPIKQRTKLN